jgi:ATP-dependent DNA ligase
LIGRRFSRRCHDHARLDDPPGEGDVCTACVMHALTPDHFQRMVDRPTSACWSAAVSSHPLAASPYAKIRPRADRALAHPGCMAAARPLPPGLAGPVDLALARPADTVPQDRACPGGCRYELKFDGFRVAVVRTASGARLWSRSDARCSAHLSGTRDLGRHLGS